LEKDNNVFSLKNIAKTLKPTITKIIDSLNKSQKAIRGRANTSGRSPNESSIIKEKYINDLINEFEENRSRSGSRNSSKSVSRKKESLLNVVNNVNFDKKSESEKIKNALSGIAIKNENFNFNTNNSNSNSSSINIPKSSNTIAACAADNQRPKKTLKHMFSKAFNVATGKKDPSQSRLAKLLQEDDDQNNTLTAKNACNNINDMMTKIDNDKVNTTEISIKNAKLNNSSFIDLNDEEDDEGRKNKYDFTENVKLEMKKFVFNVLADNTNNDEYEFKTFYIKADNTNNVSEKNNVAITNNANDNSNDNNNNLNGAGNTVNNANNELKAESPSKIN